MAYHMPETYPFAVPVLRDQDYCCAWGDKMFHAGQEFNALASGDEDVPMWRMLAFDIQFYETAS
eukprot:5164562-Amphidinium_carterae.1